MNDEEFKNRLIGSGNPVATRAWNTLHRRFGASAQILKHAHWSKLKDARNTGPATWALWAHVFETFGETPAWLTDMRARSPEFVARLERLRK